MGTRRSASVVGESVTYMPIVAVGTETRDPLAGMGLRLTDFEVVAQ